MMTLVPGLVLLVFVAGAGGVGQCNWPATLQDSVWLDSDKGDLNFDTKTMTGLTYIVQGTFPLNTWSCFYYNDNDILIMKASTVVKIFNVYYQPFQCWKLTQITDHSFYYYAQTGKESRVADERIVLRDNKTITDITDADVESRLCPSSPTVPEYHLLVEDSQELAAVQECPGMLLDDFHYSVDGACDQGTEHWESCQDTTTMTFNYTLCATHIAYSIGGSVRCMVTVPYGDSLLVTVYNEDTRPADGVGDGGGVSVSRKLHGESNFNIRGELTGPYHSPNTIRDIPYNHQHKYHNKFYYFFHILHHFLYNIIHYVINNVIDDVINNFNHYSNNDNYINNNDNTHDNKLHNFVNNIQYNVDNVKHKHVINNVFYYFVNDFID
ncbi:hypothetical protein MAR_025224 [Mya arenaria]|uniref:Uncharacterized protein n=1 Tax=Mya arenaria TaxID=6604 RepID=A0ABY7DW59_MYAAR|nr:hypothetical protein MAR_025224 [Mya arenaria]